jgi:hypothetical protein
VIAEICKIKIQIKKNDDKYFWKQREGLAMAILFV